jgi:hypothetical protein
MECAMIALGEIVAALFELVAEFACMFVPWRRGDEPKDKE